VGDTTPVRNFEKNDSGFYDENGNVYSWTYSYFGNPEKSVQKIVKGGAWNKLAQPLTVSHAKPMFFTARSIGFRICFDRTTCKNILSDKEFCQWIPNFFDLFNNSKTSVFLANLMIDKFFGNKI